jgi:Putative zinc-finger
MCEFSSKLIAWMDGELGQMEASAIEQHLEGCSECRNIFQRCREASEAFALYRDAVTTEVFAGWLNRPLPSWLLPVVGTAATIALLLLLVPKRFLIPVRQSLNAEIVPSVPLAAPPFAADERSLSGKGGTQTSHLLARKSAIAEKARERTRAAAEQVLARGDEKTASESVVATAMSSEPVIEVVLPADGMFPPGAMPEGMTYVANMTVAAGTEPLGARAQLAGFERRNMQP